MKIHDPFPHEKEPAPRVTSAKHELREAQINFPYREAA